MQWPAGSRKVFGITPMRFVGRTDLHAMQPLAGARFNPHSGEAWSELSARPYGFYTGGAWALPRVAGAIAGDAAMVSGATGNAAAGVNLDGIAEISLEVTGAASAIAAASGLAIMSLASSATLTGIADVTGLSNITITATGSLGGIASITGSSAMAITATAQTNALAWMETGTLEVGLTADAIADAVWQRLGINGQSYGVTLTSAEKWAKLAAVLSA